MSIANGAYTRTNSYGPDMARVMPRFFIDSIEDHVASAREGRPIFRDEERVEIILPGNPQTRPVQIVNETHRQKWPDQYKAFKSGRTMAIEGTPLEEWPRLTRSMVLELKALQFFTIEQVAAASDLAIQKMGMGGRSARDLAIAFLDDAERNKLAEQQASVINRQDSEIAALRHQLEEVKGLIGPMHAELQGMKNAPHPLATSIPGMSDPVELAKQGHGVAQQQGAPVVSSLSDLTPRRRPGVKDKVGV